MINSLSTVDLRLSDGLLLDLEPGDVIAVVFKESMLRGLRVLDTMSKAAIIEHDYGWLLHCLLANGDWGSYPERRFTLVIGESWQSRQFAPALVLLDSIEVVQRFRPLIDWSALRCPRAIRFRLTPVALQESVGRLVAMHQFGDINMVALDHWTHVAQSESVQVESSRNRSGCFMMSDQGRLHAIRFRQIFEPHLEMLRSTHQPHRD